MGPIEFELRLKQNRGMKMFYAIGRSRLTKRTASFVFEAAEQLTGMRSVNDYWLPQILSEAIEAAEALRV